MKVTKMVLGSADSSKYVGLVASRSRAGVQGGPVWVGAARRGAYNGGWM